MIIINTVRQPIRGDSDHNSKTERGDVGGKNRNVKRRKRVRGRKHALNERCKILKNDHIYWIQ